MTSIVPRLNALALRIYPKRSWLFFTTIALAVAAALDVWFFPHLPARAAYAALGLLGLGLIWCWGGFLFCAWFGPESRIWPPFKGLAAVFLFVWLIVGSAGFALFALQAFLAAI